MNPNPTEQMLAMLLVQVARLQAEQRATQRLVEELLLHHKVPLEWISATEESIREHFLHRENARLAELRQEILDYPPPWFPK